MTRTSASEEREYKSEKERQMDFSIRQRTTGLNFFKSTHVTDVKPRYQVIPLELESCDVTQQ